MKYLQTYNKLNLPNNNTPVFEYLINTLKESVSTWNYFVDFEKVKENVIKIEKELNLLNVLIGKSEIEEEFIKLVEEYPRVRTVLPILIAIRNNKMRTVQIIDDIDTLISENKEDLFNSTIALTPKINADLIKFFNDSGLKNIFEDKSVKSVVDYCFGIEVGMDTNARKNRTGTSMESLVEKIIQDFCKHNKLEYISQATQTKIKKKWNFDIQSDKTNRIFDFVIYNKSKNKIFVIETNFYSNSGSKLKSTAGEYKFLSDFLKTQKIDLIWITDGVGWRKTKQALYETFLHNEYVVNIELIKKDVLNDIIL